MPTSNPVPESPETAVFFTDEELDKHRGHWLAFSAGGNRLLASCPTLKELDEKIRATGADPEEVLLDRIPNGDAIQSGSELS
jgi:hypothetical protein